MSRPGASPPIVGRSGPNVTKRIEGEAGPPWSDVTSAGTFQVAAGGRFDRHHHDCDEYWFIRRGRGVIEIDEERYTVEPGDIICTERGREHDILQLFDDELEGFWFEAVLIPGGRAGHLHRTAEGAAGHPILGRSDRLPSR